MTKIYFKLFTGLLVMMLWGCSKQDEFLDEKYNLSDVVPQTLEDFQGLLDNNDVMNNNYPSLSQIGADNYYVLDADLATLSPTERNAYRWVKDILQGDACGDWTGSYAVVLYANVVLEGLQKLSAQQAGTVAFNQVKGSALFFRAFAFYQLAQSFCKPYSGTAGLDLGLALRLTTDANQKSVRATLAQTYDRIIADLQEAETLLPNRGLKPTRPSKMAVYALLAKTYLHMRDFAKVEEYANKTLAINSTLLDYNTIPGGFFQFIPYSTNNPEYIFYATSLGYNVFNPLSKFLADTTLYRSYADADTRKSIFYLVIPTVPEKIYFKGSYTVGVFFGGIATNEVYLLKAEALARQNKVSDALTVLNALLEKRYQPPFTPLSAANQDQALKLVLAERRKELPFNGQIRWEDLRRLAQDPSYALTITRVIDGTTISLSPGDPRYVLPIPDAEIRLSNMQQNQR